MVGGQSISSWVARSAGALLCAARRARPRNARVRVWFYRQRDRLEHQQSLAHAGPSRPCPRCWRSEALVEHPF
eukprot:5582940-Pyramimonas_sp.AAC.1